MQTQGKPDDMSKRVAIGNLYSLVQKNNFEKTNIVGQCGKDTVEMFYERKRRRRGQLRYIIGRRRWMGNPARQLEEAVQTDRSHGEWECQCKWMVLAA